ncbi:MAG TPA: type II toxin-antitoxin system VapC family toxin [Bryobacteraceae bacterium]|jgi:hypothetical protein|nr:type II toxin-antitoxin system VapC family toxin [Bryobacteraceae bacterium]
MLDANILIYAHHADTRQHAAARAWFEKQLAGTDIVGLTWATIWAFIRVSTNAKLWSRPPALEEVFDRIAEWQSLPNVVLLEPGPRHRQILKSLALESDARGAMISDAVLSAIAIEHAATLVSTDRDFRRFSGLRWMNPLEDD